MDASTHTVSRAVRGMEVRRYLAVLARQAPSGALLDIRWRRASSQVMAQEFWPLSADAGTRLLDLSETHDVYAGVAPRLRRSGGRDALAPCLLLWADCDSAEAAAALDRLPAPTMLVASGSGAHRHAYWALTSALDPTELHDGNRRLAAALGADRGAVTGPATILRPAGTINHKHSRRAAVALLRLAPHLYAPDALLAELPPLPHPLRPRSSRPPRLALGDPLLAISPRTYVALLTGETVGRSGKVRCPLHDDDQASLHAWADPARGWFCFGCNRGGSIYDLAAALWLSGQSAAPLRGRQFIEVRRRLEALCGSARRVA